MLAKVAKKIFLSFSKANMVL